MLLLIDLDNTLIDRSAAFGRWAGQWALAGPWSSLAGRAGVPALLDCRGPRVSYSSGDLTLSA
jgi:hypothetical protein